MLLTSWPISMARRRPLLNSSCPSLVPSRPTNNELAHRYDLHSYRAVKILDIASRVASVSFAMVGGTDDVEVAVAGRPQTG